MTSVNFRDLIASAQDSGVSNTPIGEYDAKVATTEVKKTGGGKDSISVRFEIITGPLAGRKTAPRAFVISPESANALAFFFRDMRTLGLGEDFFSGNPPLETVASALVGKPCRIVVGTRRWNDEDREEITKIKSPQHAAGAPPAPVITPAAPATQMSQPPVYATADPAAPPLPY